MKWVYSLVALLFFSITLALFSSCSSTTNSSEGEETDTLTVSPDTLSLVLPDSTPSIDTLDLAIPTLDELMAKQKQQLNRLYLDYKAVLSTPDAIEDEAQLKRVFGMRDSLLSLIQYDVLENHFVNELEQDYEAQEKLTSELQKMGIQVVYAEGMYAGLAEAPLLADKVKEVGSEPYQLYIAFKQAYGNSLGSEYTYEDLSPEMEMIRIGEKLRQDFANSEYVELTKENYEEAILALTDVHIVLSKENDNKEWIIGGIETSFYPNHTSKSNYENFVKNYSDTKLSKITEKILKNTSSLYSIDQEASDTLYLLTAEWVSTWSQAREAALGKIQSGFDAPHCLRVKTAEGDKYAVTYRYYPTFAQAEENAPWAKEETGITKVLRNKNGLEKLEDL